MISTSFTLLNILSSYHFISSSHESETSFAPVAQVLLAVLCNLAALPSLEQLGILV